MFLTVKAKYYLISANISSNGGRFASSSTAGTIPWSRSGRGMIRRGRFMRMGRGRGRGFSRGARSETPLSRTNALPLTKASLFDSALGAAASGDAAAERQAFAESLDKELDWYNSK